MPGVACLTLRDSTERPVTVTEGTNRLVPDRSAGALLEAFRAAWGTPAPIPPWARAAHRTSFRATARAAARHFPLGVMPYTLLYGTPGGETVRCGRQPRCS